MKSAVYRDVIYQWKEAHEILFKNVRSAANIFRGLSFAETTLDELAHLFANTSDDRVHWFDLKETGAQ